MEPRDIELDVPWGKIAIKLWGDESDTPVLSVHGLMDNAGTFDAIIPLLPKYYFICIDLPGHGKSSHFPPHTPVYTNNFLLVYTLVMDYFKRNKYIIMGHSYGGQIGLLYAQIYPERVEKLIMFDTVHIFPVPAKYFGEYLEDRFKRFLELEKKLSSKSAPQYTYQEALDKLMQGRPSPLTEEPAKNLLRRMLVPVGNGKYNLSLDQRMKSFFNPLHDHKYVIETLKERPVNCPVLIVFGLDNRAQRHLLRNILNHLKKQKLVTVKYVPGHHDVHQTDPRLVAPYVSAFLNSKKSKL